MMARLLTTLLLGSCLFAGHSVATTLEIAQTSSKPEAEFRLEPYRKTIALRGSVAGVPGLFLFDTAGGITLLSPDYAAKVGCKSWGQLVGHRMMGDRVDTPRCDNVQITLGDTTFKLPTAALLDVTKFLPEGAVPVEGSIALDLFAGRAITIDFPRPAAVGRIAREPEGTRHPFHEIAWPSLARIAGARARDVRRRAFAEWAGLDGTGHRKRWHAARRKALRDILRPGSRKEGPQQANFPVSADFRAKGNAFTPDMIIDGNLGMPFPARQGRDVRLGDGRVVDCRYGHPGSNDHAIGGPDLRHGRRVPCPACVFGCVD